MKIGFNFIIGIVFVALWVGAATAYVGQVYEGGTYSWHLPILVLFVTGFPFLYGFLAGKEANK